MSLILEALKKSEAERQLGRAPGLMDLQPRRRRRGRPLLTSVLVVALLMAVGVGAYRVGLRTSGQTQEAASLVPAGTAADAPGPVDADAPVVASTRQTPAAAPSTSPALGAGPPWVESRLPSDPGFASVERESRPQLPVGLPHAAQPQASKAGPADPTPPAPPQATASTAPVAPPAAPSATAPSLAPAGQPSAEPVATAPAPSPAPPFAPAEALPELASLGHEARGRLPPLKVSMHVYTDDPAGRVVIIDGRRLREGDAIDERLRLLEIRRDGSVLELEGRRYRLARP